MHSSSTEQPDLFDKLGVIPEPRPPWCAQATTHVTTLFNACGYDTVPDWFERVEYLEVAPCLLYRGSVEQLDNPDSEHVSATNKLFWTVYARLRNYDDKTLYPVACGDFCEPWDALAGAVQLRLHHPQGNALPIDMRETHQTIANRRLQAVLNHDG